MPTIPSLDVFERDVPSLALLASRTLPPGAASIPGGMLLGAVGNTIGCAILTVQIFRYFSSFKADSKYLKFLVLACSAVQVLQFCAVNVGLYFYIFWARPDFRRLFTTTWPLAFYQAVHALGSFFAQSFFSYRIWSLSQRRSIPILTEILVIAQLGTGLAAAIKLATVGAVVQNDYTINTLVTSWISVQMAADLVIACAMIYILRTSRTGFQQTDRMLAQITVYAVSTGALTFVVDLIILIVFVQYGFHAAVLALGIPSGCLYCISIISNLHWRSNIRQRYYHASTAVQVRKSALIPPHFSHGSGSDSSKLGRSPSRTAMLDKGDTEALRDESGVENELRDSVALQELPKTARP